MPKNKKLSNEPVNIDPTPYFFRGQFIVILPMILFWEIVILLIAKWAG